MKDFAEYPEALELRELGFDEPCLLKLQWAAGHDSVTGMPYEPCFYINGFPVNTKHILPSQRPKVDDFFFNLGIPTYSQAFRWFREKYYLTWEHQFDDGNICLFVGEITYPDTSLRFFKAVEVKQDGYNEAYEKAELDCLRHLIKLIKEGRK
jgi:hypothetical protein